jgi:4-amino-4-deoxy-L-arabinose transferase-like glycosyltransferase
MKGNWILWARRVHLFLGVFFSPLLLMFIITGWWQTVTTDEEKEAAGGFFHTLMENFSNVHTDHYYPHAGASQHSHAAFKILVVAMCLALITAIGLGLMLAWRLHKKWLVVTAFLLGILLPALLAWFA